MPIDREFAKNILALYKPQTDHREAFILYNLAESINPKVIVEIGVADGGAILLWSKLLGSDGLLIPIDVRKYVEWDMNTTLCKTIFVEGDTMQDETKNKVVAILGDRKIDFLRIDGGHSYGGVKNDFDRYYPLVRDGGLVAFHDYQSGREVRQYVNDIWNQYRITQIVCPDPVPVPTDTAYFFKPGKE